MESKVDKWTVDGFRREIETERDRDRDREKKEREREKVRFSIDNQIK